MSVWQGTKLDLELCRSRISKSIDGLATYLAQPDSLDVVFMIVTQVPALEQISSGQKCASSCGCMVLIIIISSSIIIIIIHHPSSIIHQSIIHHPSSIITIIIIIIIHHPSSIIHQSIIHHPSSIIHHPSSPSSSSSQTLLLLYDLFGLSLLLSFGPSFCLRIL